MTIQWLPELRRFRKNIGSNLLIIALLGIGLASTMVIFSFTKALVIDPPPFANAAKLRQIGLVSKDSDGLDEVSAPLLAAWVQALAPKVNAQTSAPTVAKSPISSLFAVGRGTINLSGAAQNGARAERYDGGFVYGAMWTGLGVKPALGRDFQAADFAPRAAKVAILGDKLWRTRFNSDADILGKSVRLNGVPAIVIAVMRPNMSFPGREQIWTQALFNANSPGFTAFMLADAQLEQNLSVMQQLFLSQRKLDRDLEGYLKVGNVPLRDWIVNFETRTLAGIMMTAVALLLIAVCLNAASVLLVRLLAEQSQNSVRLALGSGWRPLAFSALAQSLMLSFCGAVLAGFLARVGGDYVLGMLDGSDEGFPAWVDIRNSAGRGYLYAFAFFCALLTAALPILRLRTQALSGALRQGSRTITATQNGARWLVLVQVTVSCAVVLCAGVVFQQVRAMLSHPLGINGTQVVSGRIGLFPESYPDAVSLQTFRTQLTQKLAQNAEVKSASLATAEPGNTSEYRQIGLAANVAKSGEVEAAIEVYLGYVDEHFLRTYQIPLLAGRALTTQDMATGASICMALIDARLASKMGGPTAALGQQIQMQPLSPDGALCRVVGVTAPFELNDLDGDLHPAVLAAISAMPLIAKAEPRFLTIAVRTKGTPGAFKDELAAIVSQVDADLPVYWLRTSDETIAATTAGNRVLTVLFGGLAGIALALSAAGLYGLLAFQAAQRRREIGVRIALGARAWDVLRALFGPSVRWVAIGCAAGLAIAIVPAQLLGSVLSNSEMADTPIAYGGLLVVLVLFALTTLIAAIKPAITALAVTPQSVLKQE